MTFLTTKKSRLLINYILNKKKTSISTFCFELKQLTFQFIYLLYFTGIIDFLRLCKSAFVWFTFCGFFVKLKSVILRSTIYEIGKKILENKEKVL